MSSAQPSNYVWWLAGRSAGFVAMLLITVAVILGLAMAARVVPPRWRREVAGLHQHLSLMGLAAIATHGLLLAADPWLKAGVKGITVPFALGYRPLWTGLGIIGGYLAAILALSFYARRRIGGRLWRRMHRFTVLAYLLSLAHAVGSGTDTSIPAVRYAMLASALPVVGLFALRVFGGGRANARRAAPARQAGARGRERASIAPAHGAPAPESPTPALQRGGPASGAGPAAERERLLARHHGAVPSRVSAKPTRQPALESS
jgi:sulfoxide reductase heme-binding subunit YedZ